MFIGLHTEGEGTNGEGRLKDERMSEDYWVNNIWEEAKGEGNEVTDSSLSVPCCSCSITHWAGQVTSLSNLNINLVSIWFSVCGVGLKESAQLPKSKLKKIFLLASL